MAGELFLDDLLLDSSFLDDYLRVDFSADSSLLDECLRVDFSAGSSLDECFREDFLPESLSFFSFFFELLVRLLLFFDDECLECLLSEFFPIACVANSYYLEFSAWLIGGMLATCIEGAV